MIRNRKFRFVERELEFYKMKLDEYTLHVVLLKGQAEDLKLGRITPEEILPLWRLVQNHERGMAEIG